MSWDVELSSTSSSSSDSDVLSPTPVLRRGRGRPRNSLLRLATTAPDSQSDLACPASTSTVADPIQRFFRPVGGPIPSMVGRIVQSGTSDALMEAADLVGDHSGVVAREDMRIVDVMMGSETLFMHNASPSALAKAAGVDRRKFGRRLLVLAAAAWAGTLSFLAGLVSSLLVARRAGKIKLMAVVKFCTYDETPLPLRLPGANKLVLRSKVVKRDRAGTAKVMQGQIEIAFVYQCCVSKRVSIAVAPVPCPLAVLESGKAVCLQLANERMAKIPHLDELRNLPDVVNLDATCCDKAGPNSVAEDAMYSQLPQGWLKVRLPCFAHIASTCQGRSFNTLPLDISGMIAFQLLMKFAGAVEGFTMCVAAVLLDNASVVDAAPPDASSEERRYLDALLRLCLPCTDIGRERCQELLDLLTSDVREVKIHLRVVGADAGFDLRAWAERVAGLLVGPFQIFPRHRWCNSLSSLSMIVLCFIHNLMPQAAQRWFSGFYLHRPITDGKHQGHDPWSVDMSEEEAEEQKTLAVPGASVTAGTESPTSAWVEFNAKQKLKAQKWVRSQPGDRMVVARVCMQVCVSVLHLVELIASSQWQMATWRRCQDGGKYRCRMQVVAEGAFQRVVASRVSEACSHVRWRVLRPAGRTLGMACFGFSLLFSAYCSLEQLLLQHTRHLPYTLWLLIDHPQAAAFAQRLLDMPKCVLDEFTRKFLDHFNTVKLLLSSLCKAVLIAAGVCMRFEICEVECLNAQIRRIVLSNETVGAGLQDVSARFLLGRHRALHQRFGKPVKNFVSKQEQRKARRRPCKRKAPGTKKQKCGGGGVQRAFWSERLRGAKFGSADVRKAFFSKVTAAFAALQQAGGDEYERRCALGKSATTTHRTGARAFGCRTKRAHNELQVDAKRPRVGDEPEVAERRVAAGLAELALVARRRLEDMHAACDEEEQGKHGEDREKVSGNSRNMLLATKDVLFAGEAPGFVQAVRHAPRDLVDPAVPDEVIDVEVFPCTPPAAEIGRRVLCKSAAGGSQDREPVRHKLASAWEALHKEVKSAAKKTIFSLPASGKHSLSKVSVCFRVGKCICKAGMQARFDMRASLASVLRRFFKKGTEARKVYDGNCAVLKVFSFRGRRERHHCRWWFIGFGNLNENTFCVQELVPCCQSEVVDLQDLTSASGDVLVPRGSPHDLFAVVEDVPTDRPIRCELCTLCFGAQEAFPGFVLVAVVAQLESPLQEVFWCPKRWGAQQPHARPVSQLPDVEDDCFQPLQDDPRLQEVGAGDACVLDLPSDEDPRCVAQSWELTSSDEEPAPPQPVAPRRRSSVCHRQAWAAVVDSVTSSRRVSVAASSPAGPSAAAAPDPGEPAFMPHINMASAFPQFVHSRTVAGRKSYIRLSPAWGRDSWDMRAICAEHGCSLSKNCSGERPLGRLWAWLDAGAAMGSKLEHQQHVPDLEARRRARRHFEALPGARMFLAEESGGPGRGEPEETWRGRTYK